MREQVGVDLWDFHTSGFWCAIPTNGTVTRDAHAVMGRGTARQAAKRFPRLQLKLGRALARNGPCVEVFVEERLLSFPVKGHWREQANPRLIERSARELMALFDLKLFPEVILPRPGCGNGRLRWASVRPILAPILDDRVLVITNESD